MPPIEQEQLVRVERPALSLHSGTNEFIDRLGTRSRPLCERGRGRDQVTVLEVVNSDTGIERIEEAWKQKLMTRKFGLNKN
jgi:hypothetical protein